MTGALTVVRHGETEWSRAGRHTGRTDVALTDAGRDAAVALAGRVGGGYALVLTSPLRRARETAALAGFPDATLDDDLVEWDYGDDEGLTRTEIRERRPGWDLWRDGPTGGESLASVAARAGRVCARVRAAEGPVLAFAHGHVLRVLAAVWIGAEPALGAHLELDPTTLSTLGDDRGTPTFERWNA